MLTAQQRAERDLFERVGEALYGPRWQESMAVALGVSGRSVRYWLAGRPMSPGVWLELGDLALTRREELASIMGALERHILERSKES